MENQKYLSQIKINKLDQEEYEFIIAQLCVLNNKPFEEMKNALDSLIASGLFTLKGDVLSQKLAEREEEQLNEMLVDAEKLLLKNRDPKKSKKLKNFKLEGKLQGTKSDFAFLLPFDKSYPDVFIAGANLKGAMNNDTVSVEVFATKGGKEKRLEGKVLAILERGNSIVVGKIFIGKANAIVMPDDVKFGKDIVVPLSKTCGAEDGDKVSVKVLRYFGSKKNPEGEVVEVLGKPNQIETEVKAIIRSYNLFETFPSKVVEAAQKLPQEIDVEQYKSTRRDLRNLNIFTIDGEDTRDIDDAISISKNSDGTYKLGVHIADVGEYVKFNSTIDKEAFKRGTSVYFPNLVLPMLPRELSNGICSLNEMVDRLALTVFMDINIKGELVRYDICESIIKSKKRFTYTVVQKILDGDEYEIEQNKEFVKDLQLMQELNIFLIKMREKRGAIDFDIPETKITLNELGDVLNVEKAPRDYSHRLIESFMIAANEAIATHFKTIKAPFVYRIHETPDAQKMSNFIRLATAYGVKTSAYGDNIKPIDLQHILKQVEELDCKFMLNSLCLRSLKKAKYSPDCLGHFGIASPMYCHFTSPIRRYPDLTIHRIIKLSLRNELEGKTLSEQKQFVVSSAFNSSEREQAADKVERDVDDLYRVFYMTHHVGEEFEGIISSVTNFGVFVQLDNTVEGLIKIGDLPRDGYVFDELDNVLKGAKNTYTIGKRVKVKCVGANVLAREIDFVLIP